LTFKNSNLTRWIVLLPIISVFITAFILIAIGIDLANSIYKDELNSFRIEIIKTSKKRAILKVEETERNFLLSEKILKKVEKEKIQELVSFSVNLMDNFYRQNENLSKKELLKQIKKRLRDIRFFKNKTGYFFIYDLKGTCILLPPNPSFEGKNLINLKDASGKFSIKEAIKFLKKNKSGFFEWYWYKPNDKTKMKKKIGYLYLYKPLDIYIGTARYEEDILKEIKHEILSNFKFNEERGKFFIYSGSGEKLYSKNIYLDKNQIQNIKSASKIIDSGFFISQNYIEGFDIENATKTKSFYVKYIPEFDWVIGTNTYDVSILKEIENKKRSVIKKVNNIIWDMVFIVVISVFVILFLMLTISNKLSKILKKYQKSLVKKNRIMKKQKEELAHQVEHDILTSLPNRFKLTKKLNTAIKYAKRNNKKLALMLIDIDHFKEINDSFGHDIGDILLQTVAKRIKESIRTRDLVARLGGDEFIILIENYEKIDNILVIVKKIQKTTKEPIKLSNFLENITLSIGISLYPSDGETPEELLKNADIAMYEVKKRGRNGYGFFKDKTT
jgi:diguanylate cyclase (GGDEF)-like protein